jgi:hypothetical protein
VVARFRELPDDEQLSYSARLSRDDQISTRRRCSGSAQA